jgi:hypothetical protein
MKQTMVRTWLTQSRSLSWMWLLCFEVRSPGANFPMPCRGLLKLCFGQEGSVIAPGNAPGTVKRFSGRVHGRVPGHFPNQVCLLKNLADPPYITAQTASDPATRIPASPAGGRSNAKPNRPVVHLQPHPVRIDLAQLEILQKFTPHQALFPSFSIPLQIQHLKNQ